MSEYEAYKLKLAERLVIAVETLAGIRTPPASGTVPSPKPDEVWKKDPATDKQKAYLINHSIPFTEPISKGTASEKIDTYIEAQKKGR